MGAFPRLRLARLASHIGRRAAQQPAPPLATEAAADSLPARPLGQSDVRPTLDAEQALEDFRNEGFCVLKDVLSAAEVRT